MEVKILCRCSLFPPWSG